MTILNLLFYVDLETFSKLKLICVPTHYYWSIPLSAVNSIIFKTVSYVCWIYVAEVLIIHFCRYYHLRLYHAINTKVRSILGGQLHLWIHICVLPFEGPPHLWLQSHICLTLDDVGGQMPSLVVLISI